MAIATYTTYDTVRAVLGVSARELKDDVIGLALFEQQFLLELSDMDASGNGSVMAQYNIAKGLAPAQRSVQQQQLYDIVNMFAAYSVARQLLTGASLAVPQVITDGKASLTRFDAPSFDGVRAGVLSACSTLVKRIKAITLALVPGALITLAPDRVMITNVGVSDPVTGV